MNRHVYTIAFYLFLPLIVLRLLWRARKAPAYARRWRERFGLVSSERSGFTEKEGLPWLWIHAVSVGEVNAASPIIRELLAEQAANLVVTTMTPTGSDRVRELFGHSVCHTYAPYDYPGALKRFLHRFNPRLLILMETELWPNTVHYSHLAGVKVMVANARLSEKSWRGYNKFARLGGPMLQQIDLIAAQAASDAQRFRLLGVPDARLAITGSVKFENDLPADLEQRLTTLSARLDGQRPVLIAASTREGEEARVLVAFKQCLRELPELLLVLVPRHPERFDEVARLCEAESLPVVRRSGEGRVTAMTKVFLGDSMGEMAVYYGLADVAFVGGSLVDTGCQNVVEPAAMGLPVLVGPSQYNFQAICEQLEEAGALKTVAGPDALAAECLKLLKNSDLREHMGQAGVSTVAANRGALQRTIELIHSLLK